MKIRGLVLGAAAILFGLCLYLSFELGRYEAGFSLFDLKRADEAQAQELARRDAEIEGLERQVAQLSTSRDIDAETYTSIKDNLAELEARIQSQEEELVFYRGIVSPGDGVAGLRIQNVEIEPDADRGVDTLRVLLVQAIVHSERVTGSMRMQLSGTENGAAVAYGLDEIGGEGAAKEIPYGFRYFQELEADLNLPEGFEPEELEIQVWPRSPRGETIVQQFDWAAVTL